MTKNSGKAYIGMILSMLIVGTVGVFRRSIPLSSTLLAFLRGLIGAFSILIFALLTKKRVFRRIAGKKLAGMILNGAFIGVNWILLFEAFNFTSIAKATLAYYMQPTIVLLLSPLFFKEKLTGRKLLCAAAALGGMVLVSGVIGASEASAGDLKGVLFGLGAACFYSAVVILNKKIAYDDPYQQTMIQLFCAAAAMLPYLLIKKEFSGVYLDSKALVLTLTVCIVHTGAAYVLYFGSMRDLKAQTISALSYIDPVTAMLVSALVLRERLSVSGLFGAALILGSALIGEMPLPAHISRGGRNADRTE